MPITVLIADDNALVRAALRQVLENEKLGSIVEAENGKEAVAKAQELKPDLVILDLAMPLLDGFATAREIGTILPGVPILMHTLYWSPRVEIEALKVGVRKTVSKSDSSVLIAAVRELLPASVFESAVEPAQADLSGSSATVSGPQAASESEAKDAHGEDLDIQSRAS